MTAIGQFAPQGTIGGPSSRARESRSLHPHDVNGLIGFVGDTLPTLRRTDGLFCFDRRLQAPELCGQSVRYSILVLIGLLKQAAHGGIPSVDVENLYQVIESHVGSLGVGDLSLLLWAESRMRTRRAAHTVSRLERSTTDERTLARLEGMEAAWFTLGTLEGTVAGLTCRALFDRAYTHLLTRRSPSSPLFRHTAADGWRTRLPNFATEVYTLLALAEVARHELAPDAEAHARALAETLIALRLPDAGWPWLYDADRAVVIEPYEIYSVHQDSMAPMALFALSDAVGDPSYARAAVEGFHWCFGRNELGFTFYDPAKQFAHRSIRRRGSAHALNLWANTGLGGVLRSNARTGFGGVEVNTTCRPYHLGWILEAWAGREHLHALVAAT